MNFRNNIRLISLEYLSSIEIQSLNGRLIKLFYKFLFDNGFDRECKVTSNLSPITDVFEDVDFTIEIPYFTTETVTLNDSAKRILETNPVFKLYDLDESDKTVIASLIDKFIESFYQLVLSDDLDDNVRGYSGISTMFKLGLVVDIKTKTLYITCPLDLLSIIIEECFITPLDDEEFESFIDKEEEKPENERFS